MSDRGMIGQAGIRIGPESQPVPASGGSQVGSDRTIYDLRAGGGDSNGYFAEVSQFCAAEMARVEARAGVLLDGYSRHVKDVLSEAPRSREEYALELLTVGMALKIYEEAAEAAPLWAIRFGEMMVLLREHVPLVKPLADRVRAVLPGFWIEPAAPIHRGVPPPHARPARPPLERMSRMIGWLRASGEFEQEAERLANWRGYLGQLRAVKSAHWMTVAVELFCQFEEEAARRLGPYTAGVEGFLEGEYARRGLREDRVLCGRLPVEYHLSMMAAELLNQGAREAFERSTRKVVLVPACMRGAKAAGCRAQVSGLDVECAACDPDCPVHRITERMRAAGAKVYIVPHEEGFSRWLARWEREPDVGVTAVSCALTIPAGGYEMRTRRIGGQCVPLDFPGCQRHWRRKRIPTGVNEERLVQLVSPRPPGTCS